jgi:peptidyl-prolyl cis-trans isomerase C
MLEQINKLPAGEVFVVPQRGALLFNRVTDQRAVPFTGEPAISYAINVLRNQKVQEAVGRQVELVRKEAAKSTVYNEAYKPAPAAKAAPGKAQPAATPPAAAPAAK